MRTMTEQEKYYFNTILRRLRSYECLLEDTPLPTLGSEALADEINWLDCWIDEHSRKTESASVGGADE